MFECGSVFYLFWNTTRCNRSVIWGKNKKLALIAVANILLKQVFAIAKSGLTYDEKFVSRLN